MGVSKDQGHLVSTIRAMDAKHQDPSYKDPKTGPPDLYTLPHRDCKGVGDLFITWKQDIQGPLADTSGL